MGTPNPNDAPQANPAELTQHDRDARQWAMFLHLSMLAGTVVPVAGWVAPIVIWQIKKDELPEIDEHGRIVVNWMISAAIYFAVSFLLIFVIVGIPLMAVLGIISVVFPVIGGIKASKGEIWPYPMSLRIF
jgi:uncharacterized Tic20 family protein